MDNIQRRMQQVTKTAAQWESENPILAEGLIGVVKETGRMKAGDGVKHWNELKYELDYFPAGEYLHWHNPMSSVENRYSETKGFTDGNYFYKVFSEMAYSVEGKNLYICWDRNKTFFGQIKITVAAAYNSSDVTGSLVKIYNAGFVNGGMYQDISKYIAIGDKIKNKYSLYDRLIDDGTNICILLSRLQGERNNLSIKIEFLGYVPDTEKGLTADDIKLIGWKDAGDDYEKPEYSLGNDGQFVYKDFGSPSTQAALDATIDNIKDFNYVGRIAPGTNGLSLPGYQGLILGTSEPSGNYQSQLYMSYDFGCLKRRFKWNGGWHPWTKIIEMTDMPSAINSYSGYFKLPTGHILQYGYVTNATPEGLQVTWPVAITRVPMSPIVTPEVNGEAIGYYAYSYATSSNKNNFKLHSNCPGVSWMCITQ